jgi:hypothetical protein
VGKIRAAERIKKVQYQLAILFRGPQLHEFLPDKVETTNGMVSKTEISASYRHVSTKILDEFPATMDKVSYELGAQKHKIGLSMESPVDNPVQTIESFNRQFNLNQFQKDAVVEWAWPQEAGDTMFAVVNTYTRASQFKGLSAENSYQLQRVGGNILGMLN